MKTITYFVKRFGKGTALTRAAPANKNGFSLRATACKFRSLVLRQSRRIQRNPVNACDTSPERRAMFVYN
jgi:hypothetical protein